MKNKGQQFVADHVIGLPRSGIRDFFAIVAKMPQAISLGIGEPDFVTPWHIREAAIFALEKGKTSYTDNLGLLRLRREINNYVEKNFNLSYNPDSEILVTVGVSEALDIALRAVLNPGDKVLYHEPCYVSYSPSIVLAHAQPVVVKTDVKDSFGIDPDKVVEAWEPGCKVLLLNFPTNPTGGVTEKAKLEKLANFAVEKDLLVISDEIYSELTFDGEHTSIASFPGMKERTLFLHGFSKGFAMTGFRIGYACGPSFLIEAMMKVHQYSMLCAPILSQEAAIEALKNGLDSVMKMKEAYQKRRDLIVRRFNEMGMKCHMPKGSFYAFPSIDSTGLKAIDFCRDVLNKKEVAVVPGTAFGESGEGFVRASFSTSYERILEATNRIESYLNDHIKT